MGDALHDLLARHPPIGLWPHEPIIHRLNHLSPSGGPSLFILRDDLIGFGLGGNKVRKLDYLLAHAIRHGATAIVTHRTSSFSRNAAAGAARLGLELHVVSTGDETDHNPLSRSWFDACGARLHYSGSSDDASRDALIASVEASLVDEGKSVKRLHPGGSDPIGALSYVDVFGRILEHSARTGTDFHSIVLATGSTGSHVGLLVGRALAGGSVRVMGVAVSRPADVQNQRTARLLRESHAFHQIDADESPIEIDDRFLGPGYAEPSPEGQAAARRFVAREGIVLDAVYSAKAAAAVLAWSKDGTLDRDSNVLFIHTGGNGGLYY